MYDTSFCYRLRVTLNEQADQHPSLGASSSLGQKLAVLHLLPVTRLNQSEAPARINDAFHQPGNDASSFVSLNTACSLGKTPDGLVTALQAGTLLRSGQPERSFTVFGAKTKYPRRVLNFHVFRELDMDIASVVYIR